MGVVTIFSSFLANLDKVRTLNQELDVGWVHPWVGSGWVGFNCECVKFAIFMFTTFIYLFIMHVST